LVFGGLCSIAEIAMFPRRRGSGAAWEDCMRQAAVILLVCFAAGYIDWSELYVDGSSVRASAAAAGAQKEEGSEEPPDHALGRSRGGFESKFHLLVDRGGTPLAVTLTAGQINEGTQFENVMRAGAVGQRGARRRPRRIVADMGYSQVHVRTWLRRRGIRAVIPYPCHQTDRSLAPVGGFDRAAYRRRNSVERCVGWLKAARRVATRFEKQAASFLGMLKLALLTRYLRTAFRNRA
jgi:transposase